MLIGASCCGDSLRHGADCNHDGKMEQADVDLLNQAGSLLSIVDQTKQTEELLETSSEYNEYFNLIAQSVEVKNKESEQSMSIPTPLAASML